MLKILHSNLLIFFEKGISSSVGISSPWAFKLSIYNSIASLAFIIDSSTVSPNVIQPGREGTNTVNPPSGSFFNSTTIIVLVGFFVFREKITFKIYRFFKHF